MKAYVPLLGLFCCLLLTQCKTKAPVEAGSRGNEMTIEQVAQSKTDKITKVLGLNPTQKTTVYNACVTYLETKKKLLPTKQTNRADYDAKMKKVTDEMYNKVISTLTPEQKKKLEKLKADAAAKYKDQNQDSLF